MRMLTGVLTALLLPACSHTNVPTSAPPAHQAVAVMDTVTSTIDARDSSCRMIRALDGRPICGPPRAQATTVPAVNPALPVVTSTTHLPAGSYVVIGSFENLENAVEWAGFNADFGTEIRRAPDSEPAMYRVLVGPIDDDSGPLMQAILASAGVPASWQLAACDGQRALSDKACQPFDSGAGLAALNGSPAR